MVVFTNFHFFWWFWFKKKIIKFIHLKWFKIIKNWKKRKKRNAIFFDKKLVVGTKIGLRGAGENLPVKGHISFHRIEDYITADREREKASSWKFRGKGGRGAGCPKPPSSNLYPPHPRLFSNDTETPPWFYRERRQR